MLSFGDLRSEMEKAEYLIFLEELAEGLWERYCENPELYREAWLPYLEARLPATVEHFVRDEVGLERSALIYPERVPRKVISGSLDVALRCIRMPEFRLVRDTSSLWFDVGAVSFLVQHPEQWANAEDLPCFRASAEGSLGTFLKAGLGAGLKRAEPPFLWGKELEAFASASWEHLEELRFHAGNPSGAALAASYPNLRMLTLEMFEAQQVEYLAAITANQSLAKVQTLVLRKATRGELDFDGMVRARGPSFVQPERLYFEGWNGLQDLDWTTPFFNRVTTLDLGEGRVDVPRLVESSLWPRLHTFASERPLSLKDLETMLDRGLPPRFQLVVAKHEDRQLILRNIDVSSCTHIQIRSLERHYADEEKQRLFEQMLAYRALGVETVLFL